ncbi:MAG: DMT family transporter [Tagaea sp.]|jgi:multidrug transporter EmrE-like cation transporter|nr:4-amino-4-deoxy-L-arabinose transferase [Azospirillum sp.]MCA3268695.1 4-amino-4-deoxy-L-arabinose transferase [Azospirillum sp.]MCZ8123141.1 small multi-drug resistant family protein [Magnetospirillum sp.]
MTQYLPMILLGVLLNAAAQLALKAGMNRIGHFDFALANALPIGWQVGTNPFVALGLVCYVVSVGVWLLVLSRVEVSLAYPMLSIGYVVNALIAWWFMGEALTATKIAGIATICFGVWLLARA